MPSWRGRANCTRMRRSRALLGENGAARTTLMNILFGHYRLVVDRDAVVARSSVGERQRVEIFTGLANAVTFRAGDPARHTPAEALRKAAAALGLRTCAAVGACHLGDPDPPHARIRDPRRRARPASGAVRRRFRQRGDRQDGADVRRARGVCRFLRGGGLKANLTLDLSPGFGYTGTVVAMLNEPAALLTPCNRGDR